ncbi:hypothetical protein G5C51_17375 [Streptomyces sp. A7024]|uniref:Uncharacterized protein n=1 Tax=Streptomyces coryli TaxID=1128680 RepID=A0A6G4U0I9_9ACTN|nr:hypothetical protein [Streptomyces coryli]NGN65664.1 hypothetical protein [Streptomyces coryli]
MTLIGNALIEEAAKKSGLLWIEGRALWHVWHEGAVHVLGDGPAEQPLDGLDDGGTAVIVARSKDKGGRLVSWPVRITELAPDSEAWQAAAAELKGKRLNAHDGEKAVERWAKECRLLRLEASGPADTEAPDGSLAAPPVSSPAVTRRPIPAALPRLLFRRKARR